MPKRGYEFSEYRAMWLFAMFDLPVDTKKARREYTRFRKALLTEGFTMLQYSVYARY
ncbi:MAG TPA: CRISPR-associated endonuclease Cas2, partial [Candidatus Avalokitesvara rifleensis]|uniref:CRISPR-associated endonuclease Cas2 n=1 Tax=Candidatus Avalokitesvara rifleensis TaxID=3367620 RepID=UPI00402881CD